jgi:hypothetical protein
VSAVGRVLVVVAKSGVAVPGVLENVALVEVLVVLLAPGPWKLVVCLCCMPNSFFPLHRASLQSETQGGLANSS